MKIVAHHVRYAALGIVLFAAMALLAPESAYGQIPSYWCTHPTAVRYNVDVNADNRIDALCADAAGSKWVALNEGGVLIERWSNFTINFCGGAGYSGSYKAFLTVHTWAIAGGPLTAKTRATVTALPFRRQQCTSTL